MDDATVELFFVLEADSSKEEAATYYIVAEDLLIKGKHYELVSKYIGDPIVKYEGLRYSREASLSYAKSSSGAERALFLNSANDAFIAGVLKLIAVSQAINKDEEAIEIQKRALDYFENDRIEAAIP